MKRNYFIDKFRGFTIVSMVLFHLMYNINYYWQVSWYDGTLLNKIWQISIATSFFTISGLTSNFLNPSKNIKRGIITSLIGFAISFITYLFAPEQLIIWGVLNGLGACMIITGLLQKYIKINDKLFFVFFLLFIITYNVPRGSLYHVDFFKNLYDKNLFILGFPGESFTSSDYFPIIPWAFIFVGGYLLGKFIRIKDKSSKANDSFLAKIGRHSMEIYLAHQIILYPLVTLIYNLAQK